MSLLSLPSPLLPPASAPALAREEKLQGSSSCHYVSLTRVGGSDVVQEL